MASDITDDIEVKNLAGDGLSVILIMSFSLNIGTFAVRVIQALVKLVKKKIAQRKASKN